MRRHAKGGLDTLQCEVQRHRTDGTVRWPSRGAQEQDSWFTCTLRHTEGVFRVTTFLRHSPSDASVVQPDLKWISVADRDTITTTG